MKKTMIFFNKYTKKTLVVNAYLRVAQSVEEPIFIRIAQYYYLF